MNKRKLDFNEIRFENFDINCKRPEDGQSSRDIAVIGMDAVFPLADDVNAFWQNIRQGIDCIRPFPERRKADTDEFLKFLNYSDKAEYIEAGYLEEVDKFDYRFFQITPKEAMLMDPHHRLFLQNVWKCIEESGYGGEKLKNTRTGVYVGYKSASSNNYKDFITQVEPALIPFSVVGNKPTILASRISYLLNLKGPSMLIDTACSAALVAVHLACQGLRAGDCDYAIAGGVKIVLLPVFGHDTYGLTENIGVESSDFRTRSYDEYSNGFGIGEGVVSLLLKPLHKALADGDNIHAVIKGTAINQDGASAGITAPNAVAHEDLLLKAWKDAGINPKTIAYIEGHGSATKLGDHIEIDGIRKAFAKYTNQKQFCAIGSVKSNLGHEDNIAGLAGLVKAVLALKHQEIPPSIHFNKPNKTIDFTNSPIYVNFRLKKWESSSFPRRCGVSSFGISGTNCHIVLEEAPRRERPKVTRNQSYVMTFSAKSELALKSLLQSYKDFVINESQDHLDIESVCYTANTGRAHFNHRVCFLTDSYQDFKQKILALDLLKLNGNHEIFYNTNATATAKQKYEAEAKGLINAIIKTNAPRDYSNELRRICELYVTGAEICWEELYRGVPVNKVSLPCYQFEKKRCWIRINHSNRKLGLNSAFKIGDSSILPAELNNELQQILEKCQKFLPVGYENPRQVILTGREDQQYSPAELSIGQVWYEVMGYEELDISHNYFDLGGDSLKATKISSLLNNKYKKVIPVSMLLKNPTIKDFGEKLEWFLENGDQGNEYIEIKPVDVREYYPLSPAQKRIYVIDQLENIGISYNISNAFKITGTIDREKLANSLTSLVQRHESLRTYFDIRDNNPVQIVAEQLEVPIDYYEIEEQDLDLILKSYFKPFDLSKAPLFRIGIIRTSEKERILIFDIHHMIADGTSVNIYIRDLFNFYNNKELPPLRLQYKDYAEWINHAIKEGSLEKQKQFWLEQFRDELPVLNLPLDYNRPQYQSFEGNNLRCVIDGENKNRINTLLTGTKTTLFMLLITVYNILLAKYSNQEDVTIGTPTSGRLNSELFDVTGVFINTLALRNFPSNTKTFRQFLSEVKMNSLNAFENQTYQFEELVEQLALPKDLSRNPLFDVLFVLQDVQDLGKDSGDLKIDLYPLNNNVSKFDLSLYVNQMTDSLELIFQYCNKLFNHGAIERMAKHYLRILAAACANPDMEISQFELITEQEKNRLLYDFNNTDYDYPKEKTIDELFLYRVRQSIDTVALIFKDNKITYGELNEKANKVARALREAGVGRNSIVGIMTSRSLEMLIGVIGIIKAGGAYLPIDPQYPSDRIEYMLSDSGANLLLINLKHDLKFDGKTIDMNAPAISSMNPDNLEAINRASDLLYVIYTSGSTGRPKGVMLEHRSVHNFITGVTRVIDFSANKSILCLTTISFDIFVLETIVALAKGLTIVIADEQDQRDPVALASLLTNHGINLLQATPSTIRLLLDYPQCSLGLAGVEAIMIGGEALSQSLVERIKQVTDAKIYNMYGPTETTVWSTVSQVTDSERITIGKPISNTKIYILNDAKLQPVGVPGELCIGGDGLARGYLNHDELTREKFVPNPFSDNCLIYKTGDLAKWLPDGNIQFLGRVDHQIKLRGFRIECGEIEEQIIKFPGITETIVTVFKDGNGEDFLCAYFSAVEVIAHDKLREFLGARLPEYMIPACFMQLEKFPLTPNNKVDRKKLPVPAKETNQDRYLPPQTTIENLIAKVWGEVLNNNNISMDDNFFKIGGDSIKAVRVVAMLSLDLAVQVKDIFKYQTIRQLANKVEIHPDNLKMKFQEYKGIIERIYMSDNDKTAIQEEQEQYKTEIKQYLSTRDFNLTAPLVNKNILLTGSTGYLGIHLLSQLLQSTGINLYLLIRAKERQTAKERLLKALKFYFTEDVYHKNVQRIIIVEGDLSAERFGLPIDEYEFFTREIDCVLNSAANVRHYGRYEDFYEINTGSIERLITFCQTGSPKDLHHISTLSLGQGSGTQNQKYLFTEYDDNIQKQFQNYYLKTKNYAEARLIGARKEGQTINIYRVGNLVFDSRTGRFQENIRENAFYSLIRSYISLKAIPNLALEYDFTYVDEAARSIVLLINHLGPANETYHIVNPYKVKLAELGEMLIKQGVQITNILDLEEFFNYLCSNYQNNIKRTEIDSILLHLGILDEYEIMDTIDHLTVCEKTVSVLSKLGFVWQKVQPNHIEKMIDYCKEISFIN
jgi:amino acid adenylation domain-containing protein/thioester reductase-like protein